MRKHCAYKNSFFFENKNNFYYYEHAFIWLPYDKYEKANWNHFYERKTMNLMYTLK